MDSMGTIAPSPVPLPPETLEEAGLSEEFLAGLLVKVLQHRGSAAGVDLSDALALPFPVLDDLLEQLQARRLVQVVATKGPTRGDYVFALTGDGRKRAVEELELSRYVGPAPVPMDEFFRWVRLQTIEGTRISPAELERVLEGVVLPDSMVEVLGPAVNSGRSVFLYGESGNGKTLLAKRLAAVFGQRYYVPYSVLLDGNVMIVYDPIIHGADTAGRGGSDARANGNGANSHGAGWTEEASAVLREILRDVPGHDRRFAEVRRPVVLTGGELTLEHLDLQWDPSGRMYQAPPQLKAAGGVLVIDDLGRQRVSVPQLLNRWGVPLEQRQDYLTLRSGRTLVVPFDCFVIFSTNLPPRALADDAFLRRIHYKVQVSDPSRAEYEQIFRDCCEEQGIAFAGAALDWLFAEFYANGAISPRRCHPRDILNHVRDLAEYRGEAARLDAALLEPACRTYFVANGLETA